MLCISDCEVLVKLVKILEVFLAELAPWNSPDLMVVMGGNLAVREFFVACVTDPLPLEELQQPCM